ncbi:MAG TPA: D-alanyl-D-alanine carboxypeptidase/D-alanyl-D-alanine-endopeptidase [Bacteroidales bacterium]|nr:D-alanyl-D-alanine carboxypeptidase/D-alanyl-D-alanine-endopeptidase [Bacteroidales bacterium]
MKRILFTLAILGLFASGRSQTNYFISDFVSDTAFKHAGISVCLRDAQTGDILAGYNENMALSSASLMKLVTTAVSLEMMGPGHKFETHIGYAGILDMSTGLLKGHIIIRGGGDPTLGSEYLEIDRDEILQRWANALVRAGIRKVEGRVIADASIFDYHPAASGWEWADLGNYYAAGPHGLSFSDNMYRIHFKTGVAGSRPELAGFDPEIPGLILDNQLTAQANRDNGYVYLAPYQSEGVIRGTIPAYREDFTLKASIPDPPLFTAELLHNELIRSGIEIKDPPTTMRLYRTYIPDTLIFLATLCNTISSPALEEIITLTNKESINLYAEHLARLTALFYTGGEHASLSLGIETIQNFLSHNGLNTSGLYQTDGSGLSRSNALSSAFVTSLLHYMKDKSSYPDVFQASLPKAGEEGTLEYYFRDPLFSNNLRAKSGTSTRIRNYAGYFSTTGGKEIVFAVLVNNFDCSSDEVTGRIEILLRKIIENY